MTNIDLFFIFPGTRPESQQRGSLYQKTSLHSRDAVRRTEQSEEQGPVESVPRGQGGGGRQCRLLRDVVEVPS